MTDVQPVKKTPVVFAPLKDKRQRAAPLVLTCEQARRLRELRRKDGGRSRMVKWVCVKCGLIARICSTSRPIGAVKHETRWDKDTKQIVPCGGYFAECKIPVKKTRQKKHA